MEIAIAEKGTFCIAAVISADEARGRASAHRASAFGTLSRLFSRPKDEDVTIADLGLCYLPLWHAKAHLHFVYDRNDTYKVSTKAPHVVTVTVGGNDHAVAASAIELPVVEHCERDEQRELWLEAVNGQSIDAQAYLKGDATSINLDEFAPEGAKIIAPAIRASAVIRKLLGDDFRPADADDIKEEKIDVECIDLYLRPTFGFKYTWAAKNKTAEVAIDAITGELQVEPPAAIAAVGKLLKPETLFDIGAETLNLVVPGGAIALRVAKAIADKNKA